MPRSALSVESHYAPLLQEVIEAADSGKKESRDRTHKCGLDCVKGLGQGGGPRQASSLREGGHLKQMWAEHRPEGFQAPARTRREEKQKEQPDIQTAIPSLPADVKSFTNVLDDTRTTELRDEKRPRSELIGQTFLIGGLITKPLYINCLRDSRTSGIGCVARAVLAILRPSRLFTFLGTGERLQAKSRLAMRHNGTSVSESIRVEGTIWLRAADCFAG